MYTKVIVPLDGSELSEQALPYAQLVAGALGAPIELVQAYDVLPPGLLGAQSRRVAEQLQQGAHDRALAALEPARQRLAAAGHSVGVVAQRGAAADTIAAQAGTDPTALVVMGTHGRGGISRWVMGSVTDKVLHSVPNPMLIVRAAATGAAAPEIRRHTVVVPLDGSALSELALPHAVSIAGALTARMALLRVTPTEGYYRQQITALGPEMVGIHDFDPASPEEMAAEDAAQVSQYLAEVSSRWAGEHAYGMDAEHAVHDNVAQTIMERAAAQPSLVVMTTHGRSGVGRMALGSVTDRVIRHSGAPTLVIR